METHKSGTPCFLCRSLLLSTTVLNNSYVESKIYFYKCWVGLQTPFKTLYLANYCMYIELQWFALVNPIFGMCKLLLPMIFVTVSTKIGHVRTVSN